MQKQMLSPSHGGQNDKVSGGEIATVPGKQAAGNLLSATAHSTPHLCMFPYPCLQNKTMLLSEHEIKHI